MAGSLKYRLMNIFQYPRKKENWKCRGRRKRGFKEILYPQNKKSKTLAMRNDAVSKLKKEGVRL